MAIYERVHNYTVAKGNFACTRRSNQYDNAYEKGREVGKKNGRGLPHIAADY